jgi:hypothetical protein
MYYGYGSPVFHYYASLTYWLGSAAHLLLGYSALDFLRWLIALGIFISGAGMYLFMRQQVGRLAGVLAGVAYVYSPYLFYTEPYGRGAYPEMLAFVLLPYFMLAFGRVLRTARAADMVLAACMTLLLILTHNLMALTFAVLLVGWILWQSAMAAVGYVRRLRKMRSATDLAGGHTAQAPNPPLQTFLMVLNTAQGRAFIALALGVLLGAFFWLPVVLEAGAVTLRNLTAVAELDYQQHFIPLSVLLWFVPTLDQGAINGLVHVFAVGVAQWAFALSGVIAIGYYTVEALALRRKFPLWQPTLFFALAALALLFLITPAASSFWESFRLLQYLQFPWRFLGPLAFCLAFLVGLNAVWIERVTRNWSAGWTAVFVALPILLAFPMFNPPEWLNKNVDETIGGYLQEEISLRQSGTTYTNEYRPAAVAYMPGHTPRLIADYSDGYPINKANPPAGVNLALIRNDPQYNEWTVQSDSDFTLEVFTFAWAGWTAEVDGQIVPITPSPTHGLITFPVPAGAHTVKLYLGLTIPRILGNVLSALGVIGLLAVLRLLSLPEERRVPRLLREPIRPEHRTGLAIAALIVFGLGIPLLAAGEMWRNTPYGSSPAQYVVNYQLGDDTRLIGYDLNGTEFRRGDVLQLRLYWLPLQMGTVNFSTFVHVALPETRPAAQADKLHPGGRAMKEWWFTTGYIFDDYTIPLPSDMAAGEYQLYVGFYTCELMPADNCGNGFRPVVTDASGNAIGDKVPLTVLRMVE